MSRKKLAERGPLLLSLATLAAFLAGGLLHERPSGPDVRGFAALPVLEGGRVKPLDSVARTSLLVISGRQTAIIGGRSVPAAEWLLDVLFRPAVAEKHKVFLIDDPDVLGLMGMEQKGDRRFSLEQLGPHLDELRTQAEQAGQVKPEQRSRFQRSVAALGERIDLFQRLADTVGLAGEEDALPRLEKFESAWGAAVTAHLRGDRKRPDGLKTLAAELERYRALAQAARFYPVPTYLRRTDRAEWVSVGQAVIEAGSSMGDAPEGTFAFAALGDAYRASDAAAFNERLRRFSEWLDRQVPTERRWARAELAFNDLQPFYAAMLLYLAAFLAILAAPLLGKDVLPRYAYALAILAFAIHTAGLVARMVIGGRPPVTNLYSSAVFVGWVAAFLGILLETYRREGFALLVSSAIGGLTLLIAHHLAAQGDTIEVMRAVLDSNFWLATHVTCITVGYGSTFLSGSMAVLYILRERFDRGWTAAEAEKLDRLVYGVICFSLFFSFVGTILGGIWADQSWGRFWGWDPKENGALMIVLWNAFLLHARWGAVARKRALMTLVVFGNVVTSLSWFGVNMLGIGLHSYGFMDKAFHWLMLFIASQLAVMWLGAFPDRGRRSLL